MQYTVLFCRTLRSGWQAAGQLPDKGRSCFTSGANAAISGDMLTTAGITTQTDMELLKGLGYEVGLCNEYKKYLLQAREPMLVRPM